MAALSTTYVEILAISPPFDYGVDDQNRILFSCNFESKSWSATPDLEADVMSILSAHSLVTVNVNVSIGSQSVIPSGPGPHILIIATGGMAPNETHNGDKYSNSSFQTVVRAQSYLVAKSLANSIWAALDGLRGVSSV